MKSNTKELNVKPPDDDLPLLSQQGEIIPIRHEPPKSAHWLSVIDKMLDKGVGAELLAKVFEMQMAWEKEQQRKAFVSAFAAFKSEAPAAILRTGRVGFESKGQQVGYQHVQLDVALEALVPIMSKNGLALSWETTQDDKGILVTCRIEHCDGYSKTVSLRGLPDASGSKNAIQAVGSAVYYLQRYTLMAALGMGQKGEDDDAGKSGLAEPTEEMWKELNTLLDETGLTDNPEWMARFKKWAKIETIAEMPASFFPKAIDWLKKVKAKGGQS